MIYTDLFLTYLQLLCVVIKEHYCIPLLMLCIFKSYFSRSKSHRKFTY